MSRKGTAVKVSKLKEEFDEDILRTIFIIVNEYYLTQETPPKKGDFITTFRNKTDLRNWTMTELNPYFKILGYYCKGHKNNAQIILSNTDILMKRIQYLSKIYKYRNESRNISYISVFVEDNNTFSRLKSAILKDVRVVWCSGSENGIDMNSLLVLNVVKLSHKDIVSNTITWMKNRFLSYLSPLSVIVMDNQLYDTLLENVKDVFKMCERMGHDIIPTPPFLQDFNPMEHIRNKLNYIYKSSISNPPQIESALIIIQNEHWTKMAKHAKTLERDYLTRDTQAQHKIENDISDCYRYLSHQQ